MSIVSIIFPHQLFDQHPALHTGTPVILVEEELFFRQYPFHKQKLLLHRASMKAYEANLISKGFQVEYIESEDSRNRITALMRNLNERGITKVSIAYPNDYLLNRRIQRAAKQYQITIAMAEGPDFLTSIEDGTTFFNNKTRFHQTDFYIHQRKKLDLLVDEKLKPIGGKWSMDNENRKKVPKGYKPPHISFPESDEYLHEAIEYVSQKFSNNPGKINPDNGKYPWAWTKDESIKLLEQFTKERLANFGDYEDAMPAREEYLHHSILSPMLNIGLITPSDIVHISMAEIQKGKIPINSAEGFIRQIIGWREFIRTVYVQAGVQQRTSNYWGFTRRIPKSFYDGTTGILPIDNCIKKLHSNAYLHHIERLMVLGNFFLLCEFDPNDVYQWFMELFIDAYDWVMVPNVYGMTQFADGGIMMTKPYISGSNYIFKMSDYKKESAQSSTPQWHEIWDGLFWRFMSKHRKFFLQNPRLGMLVNTFDKMDKEKKKNLLDNAQFFLDKLDSELLQDEMKRT
jgi:deoxyribodipyrimidine photolyase-related protein